MKKLEPASPITSAIICSRLQYSTKPVILASPAVIFYAMVSLSIPPSPWFIMELLINPDTLEVVRKRITEVNEFLLHVNFTAMMTTSQYEELCAENTPDPLLFDKLVSLITDIQLIEMLRL